MTIEQIQALAVKLGENASQEELLEEFYYSMMNWINAMSEEDQEELYKNTMPLKVNEGEEKWIS